MNRREFLKISSRAALGCVAGGLAYSVVETERLQITRLAARVPNLPAAFAGKTIAFLSDLHHSIVVPRYYLEHAVKMVNDLRPDFVILGGDYVTAGHKYSELQGHRYITPCFEILKNLHAPLGKYAVHGNHDHWAGPLHVSAAMAHAGFVNLTNVGVWVEQGAARLRICGVGDLWTQHQDLPAALADAEPGDAVILATHNPDFAEEIKDDRVGLMLSGHTHGGQVVLPLIGAPFTASKYGQRYRYGLVRGPHCSVYVTSGVGVLPIPVRLNCLPEIALLTLC